MSVQELVDGLQVAEWERSQGRTSNETLEERLLLQVFVVLLEVLFRGGDQLDADQLVPA